MLRVYTSITGKRHSVYLKGGTNGVGAAGGVLMYFGVFIDKLLVGDAVQNF